MAAFHSLEDNHAIPGGAAPSLEPTEGPLTFEELQLAARNRGMPLEALRYDLTPTGLHYLLTHWDIPELDPRTWRLQVGGQVAHALELSLGGYSGKAAAHGPGHPRVCRQRTSPLRPSPVEPAMATRGDQHG